MNILSVDSLSTKGDSSPQRGAESLASKLSVEVDWRTAMRSAIRDRAELRQRLQLPHDSQSDAQLASEQFEVFVPLEYLARIRPGDPADPLLLQVLPRGEEVLPQPGYTSDPLAEADASPVGGLLHKYRGRVLFVVSGICPVHCRYCFRRHFPYDEIPQGRANGSPVSSSCGA